ncbi:MAG: metal dependent hydrolase of the beta-lactamase superfamily [Chlamydiia bacterium]|nr:metal dependent hydrolase of the beta-lactamase superfamily [Chlamydiia bacterium]
MADGSLLFLGTGASSGIPVIGCTCVVCTSSNPKDRRLRTSALIKYNGKNFLIDAGPDIRRQALQHQINTIDGLFITHPHYDHVGGLEELRVYNFIQKSAIHCMLHTESLEEVKKLFYYLFSPSIEGQNHTSQFDFIPVTNQTGECNFEGLQVRYFCYVQGNAKVLGLRIGDLAYFTDIKSYTDEIFEFVKGVKTLVVSALGFTPSRVHLTVEEAVAFAERSGAEKSYFIHLAHEIEHNYVESLLPQGMHLAYDGLEIPLRINDDN